MWPRNLLRKTCFSTLVQINERRLDSSIIQTRSADRSASVTRVNEHASDIKTASGLADALLSKTAVRPSKPLLLSGDKCLFTLRIEPLSMQSKSIQVDGEKRNDRRDDGSKRFDERDGKITKRITATRD